MAVIQISKIQVRRGLQENLPQLASGEMGWSVDEQRLWIGNGTLTEGAPEIGNTEILTSNSDVLNAIESYTFKGQESGYTSRTGPSATTAVKRSLQNKFDEQISLRDFITDADILSGDYTIAIQRALDEIYPIGYINTIGVRRVLHIPAGVYNISANILIPPYATIVGDGASATVINKTAGSDNVIRLKDSRGQTGANVDVSSSTVPSEITIKGLTLSSDVDTNIVLLESCQYIDFDEVHFVGAVASPLTSGNNTSAVLATDVVAPTSSLTFNRCRFESVTYGVGLRGSVNAVTVNDSVFTNLYIGVLTDTSGASPQGIRVVSSLFQEIAKQAIYSQDSSSVVSAFNYYTTVGNSDSVTMDSGSANVAVLSWGTSNNYSIGDLFQRDSANIALVPVIETLGSAVPVYNQRSAAGSVQDTPGYIETLVDDSTGNTALTISSSTTNLIDYSISRGIAYRVGTIKVTQLAGSAIFEDDYSEVGATGVTLDFTTSGTNAVMSYTTSNIGADATLRYTIRSFV